MPELLLTLDAMHKTERRKQKFAAALQGIDLDEEDKQNDDSNNNNKKPLSVEEIQARAVARLSGDESLANAIAEGFTSESGLEYKMVGGLEIG